MSQKLSFNEPRVVHETIDGEVIVIDLATGTYFSLQGGAANVWKLIGGGYSPLLMATALAAAYPESDESIRARLDTFLKELKSEELVVDATDQSSPPTIAVEISVSGAFTPHLEKHTDMAELILLDPVHEVDSMGWPHRQVDDAQGAV